MQPIDRSQITWACDGNIKDSYQAYLKNITSCVDCVKKIYDSKNHEDFKEIARQRPEIIHQLDFICAIADNTKIAANIDIALELAIREHELGPIQNLYRTTIGYQPKP